METIQVKPIVFYPKDTDPEPELENLWSEFNIAAREKYLSLLKGRDTFALSSQLAVVQGKLTAPEYRAFCIEPEGLIDVANLKKTRKGNKCDFGGFGVEAIFTEILLSDFDGDKRYTRYTLPYVLSVLIIDEKAKWFYGGGRPVNGEINNGGGIAVISSFFLKQGKLMSTLVHELGHAFGLSHTQDRWNSDKEDTSDWGQYLCYYFLTTTNSIMGYNEINLTNETDPDKIPGCLLGDEIDALSQNKKIFPNLYFDNENDFDCPPGNIQILGTTVSCPEHDKVSRQTWLGPFHLFWCIARSTTIDGNIVNLNDRPKFLQADPGRKILKSDPYIGFEPNHMWLGKAEESDGGWVVLDVVFPTAVTLDTITVYTQHSGKYQKAAAIMVGWQKPEDSPILSNTPPILQKIPIFDRGIIPDLYEIVAYNNNSSPNTNMTFEPATAQIWRFFLKAESSANGLVAVRGLRFYFEGVELFPIPFYQSDLFPEHLLDIYEIYFPEPPVWPEFDIPLRGVQRNAIIGPVDNDNAILIWEEYKYRHDLIWRHLIRSTIVIFTLVTLEFTDLLKVQDIFIWLGFVFAAGYNLFTLHVVAREIELLERIKEVHRRRQQILYGLDQSSQKEERLGFEGRVRLYLLLLFIPIIVSIILKILA